ncbi:hypothetical protein DBV05_g6471 [Lasiodiplodia theobromae]|uniref:Uncharacterized protein n=1 Tax=Lasiodiplodia theobromae TaxID=45133 RepID=A0A5N5DB15_9PEZI|nr:hypothetical protein DBV05_g6471 [Lasiodiplodia theobromae]
MAILEVPNHASGKSISQVSSHSVKQDPYSTDHSVPSGPLTHHTSTTKQPGKHLPGMQSRHPPSKSGFTSLPPSCTLHTSPERTSGSPILGSPTPTPSRSRLPPQSQSQPTPPAAPTTSIAKLTALRAGTVKRPVTSKLTSRSKRFKVPEPSQNTQSRDDIYVSHLATLPAAARTPREPTVALSGRGTTTSDVWAPLSSSHDSQSPDWYHWQPGYSPRPGYQPLDVRKPETVPRGEQEQQQRPYEGETSTPQQLRNNGAHTKPGPEEQGHKEDQSQDYSQEDVTTPYTARQTALQQPSSSKQVASSPLSQPDMPQLITVSLDKALMSRVRKVSVTTIVYELEPASNTAIHKNMANSVAALEKGPRKRRDV